MVLSAPTINAPLGSMVVAGGGSSAIGSTSPAGQPGGAGTALLLQNGTSVLLVDNSLLAEPTTGAPIAPPTRLEAAQVALRI